MKLFLYLFLYVFLYLPDNVYDEHEYYTKIDHETNRKYVVPS